MRGKGVPHPRHGAQGRLVVINVEVPARVSPEQRKLFESLARHWAASPQERGSWKG